MSANTSWVIIVAIAAACFIALGIVGKGCNDSDNHMYQTCIQSSRSAMDCALIVRGTK